MIVYRIGSAEGGQQLERSSSVNLLRRSGRPQAETWVPFDVELKDREGRRRLEPVDTPFLSPSFLVVKDAALPRVAQELAPYVEFLPLRCPQEPMTLLNVLQVVDALDEDEADLKRFRDGKVMTVNRHVFRPDAVPRVGLFRIPQALSQMFCAQETADLLRERLSGLDVQPVWEG